MSKWVRFNVPPDT